MHDSCLIENVQLLGKKMSLIVKLSFHFSKMVYAVLKVVFISFANKRVS